MTTKAYPPDLARYVEAHWPDATKLRVPSWELEEVLSIAFQASLTEEEARRSRFRLLLSPPEDLPERGEPTSGVLRMLFDQRRPFEVEELRRLAPAVPFETSLIGVNAIEGELGIWGVAHSGPAWLAPSWGGRSLVPNWTYDPIVHITAPGQLAVRCAGKLVGALERGALIDAQIDVFESSWLPAMFTDEREHVRDKMRTRMQTEDIAPIEVEHMLIGKITQHMLRRAIQLVRGAHHGGLILVTNDTQGLRMKYPVTQDEPSHRYQSLLMQILNAVAKAAKENSIGWADFLSDESVELDRLEHAVFEWSRAIANLAAIDGAVLLDKRFGLVGFGVEVFGELASPVQVSRAFDSDGDERKPEAIEIRGTRHRAAYRFVNAHPGALAIVISHDGGVSFVANRDHEVIVWEQSVGP